LWWINPPVVRGPSLHNPQHQQADRNRQRQPAKGGRHFPAREGPGWLWAMDFQQLPFGSAKG